MFHVSCSSANTGRPVCCSALSWPAHLWSLLLGFRLQPLPLHCSWSCCEAVELPRWGLTLLWDKRPTEQDHDKSRSEYNCSIGPFGKMSGVLSLRNKVAVRFECFQHFFCAICYFMFTLLRIVHWCNILNPSITAIYQILCDRTHIIVFDWSVMLNVLSLSVGLKMPWTCLIVTFPKVSRQTNREPVTLTWAQAKVKCDSGDSGWILTGGVLAAIAVMAASKVYQHWC